MSVHTYKVGDEVAELDAFGNVRKRTVTAVRAYKQRTKVTLDDGGEWDTRGNRWRGDTYTRDHICPWSSEMQARLLDQRRRLATDWIVKHWADLSEETRAQIGDAAYDIRMAAWRSERLNKGVSK